MSFPAHASYSDLIVTPTALPVDPAPTLTHTSRSGMAERVCVNTLLQCAVQLHETAAYLTATGPTWGDRLGGLHYACRRPTAHVLSIYTLSEATSNMVLKLSPNFIVADDRVADDRVADRRMIYFTNGTELYLHVSGTRRKSSRELQRIAVTHPSMASSPHRLPTSRPCGV